VSDHGPKRVRGGLAAVLAAGVVLAGAACGGGGGGSTALRAGAAGRCSSTQLRAWAGGPAAGVGSVLLEFGFVNASDRRCSLIGYPALAMRSAAGKAIKTTELHVSAGFDGIARKLVTLAAGARAYFGVEFTDGAVFKGEVCPTSAQLLLTPPGAGGEVTLTGARAHITPYGGGATPQQACGVVFVSPVTAKMFLAA
jgi:uncharacterized protein DUF4232